MEESHAINKEIQKSNELAERFLYADEVKKEEVEVDKKIQKQPKKTE